MENICKAGVKNDFELLFKGRDEMKALNLVPLAVNRMEEVKEEESQDLKESGFDYSEEKQALHVNIKSFNILRAVTDTNFFSKVDLSPTARLVFFSLANMYNPKKGFVYPKNTKLMKCTGSGERAVSLAVGELKKEGIIVIVFEENFRKIYFTQKTYEILGVISEKSESLIKGGEEQKKTVEEGLNTLFEKGIDFKEDKSLKNELNSGDDKNVLRVVKSEQRVVKNEGGVAKNEGTCHEQKKEQIKKQFVGNDFIFLKERNEVKEAFREGGYLRNKVQSEIILNGFHRHNVKKDEDFKAVLRIKKVWNFETSNFDILRFFEEKRKEDRGFAQKIEKIENDVDFSLIGFEKEIEELRTCWQDY